MKCVESATGLPLFTFLFLRSDGVIALVFHVVSIVSVYAETVFESYMTLGHFLQLKQKRQEHTFFQVPCGHFFLYINNILSTSRGQRQAAFNSRQHQIIFCKIVEC